MFQRIADELAALHQELQRAEAAAGAPDGNPWPDGLAGVYRRLHDSATKAADLVELDHGPEAQTPHSFRWVRGLADCPDLLACHVPALLRTVSGRLSQVLLLLPHKESKQAPGASQEVQAGGSPGVAQQDAAALATVTAEAATAVAAADVGASLCVAVLAHLVQLACQGVTAATHASLAAMLLRPQLDQLLRSVTAPEQLRTLATVADALGATLAAGGRARAAAGSLLNTAWHEALGCAMMIAHTLETIGSAILAACTGGSAGRPSAARIANSLQQSGLVEATCRMLLAPERLLQAEQGTEDDTDGAPGAYRRTAHTAAELWNGAVLRTLKALVFYACAACDGRGGAGVNAVPAELCSALAGPAMQRFMRAVGAAALGQAPPLDAVCRPRCRELLALLPSADDAAALLLSDGTTPLPPGLLHTSVCEGTAYNGTNFAVADMLTDILGCWARLLSTKGAPPAVHAACPPAPDMLRLQLARLGVTLRHPRLPPWEVPSSALPDSILHDATLTVLAMPRAPGVQQYAEAVGQLLHAHFVAALVLADWHDAVPAAARAAAAARADWDPAMPYTAEMGSTLKGQMLALQACMATRPRQLTALAGRGGVCSGPPELLRALADDLLLRATGRLADELLRWQARSLPWLQAAGALAVMHSGVDTAIGVLRMLRAEPLLASPRGAAGGAAATGCGRGGGPAAGRERRGGGHGAAAGGRGGQGGQRAAAARGAPRGSGAAGSGGRRRQEEQAGQQQQPGQQGRPSASSMRRTARELGSILSAVKVARLVEALVRAPGAGQQYDVMKPLADLLMVLLTDESRWGLDRDAPGYPVLVTGSEQAVLLAAWPVVADAAARLACTVVHAHMGQGPWAAHTLCAPPADAPHEPPELLSAPLSVLSRGAQHLVLLAQAAQAAGQPPLEPAEGSTGALLAAALQAPAVEALLALTAEYLAHHPRVTEPEGSQAFFGLVLTYLLKLLACMAGVAGLQHRVRRWLLPPPPQPMNAAAAGGPAAGSTNCTVAASHPAAASGSTSSSGLPPYDLAHLRAERLLAMFKRHDPYAGLMLHEVLGELVRGLRGAEGPQMSVAASLDVADIYPPAQLPADAPDAALLQLCANPCCVNLDGASERDLPRLRCAGCHAVSYCSQRCQAQHWRTGGHKRECAALARQQKKPGSGGAGPAAAEEVE